MVHEFEIFNAIVERIGVLMMNVFALLKATSNGLLNHHAMLITPSGSAGADLDQAIHKRRCGMMEANGSKW
jgi:hypothetical protein